MVSTLSGGGIPVMLMTEDAKQPTQPLYPPSVPAVLSASNERPGRVDAYQHRQSMGLGTTLIIVGFLAVIFNSVGFTVSDRAAWTFHGISSGVMFIITGSFGVAAITKNKCLIITFMVLAIISAVMIPSMLMNSIAGIAGAGYNQQDAARSVEIVLAVLSIVAAITSIWGSAICCQAVCCCSNRPTMTYVIMPSQYASHSASVYIDQQPQHQMQSGAISVNGSHNMLENGLSHAFTITSPPPYGNDGLVATGSGMLISPPHNATASFQ